MKLWIVPGGSHFFFLSTIEIEYKRYFGAGAAYVYISMLTYVQTIDSITEI